MGFSLTDPLLAALFSRQTQQAGPTLMQIGQDKRRNQLADMLRMQEPAPNPMAVPGPPNSIAAVQPASVPIPSRRPDIAERVPVPNPRPDTHDHGVGPQGAAIAAPLSQQRAPTPWKRPIGGGNDGSEYKAIWAQGMPGYNYDPSLASKPLAAPTTPVTSKPLPALLAGVAKADTLTGGSMSIPKSAPGDPMNGRSMVATGIFQAATELGVDPIDLATAVSYETAGTFNPTQAGPRTQWGRHRGLIQWGEPQAKKYLNGDFSVQSQSKGMVDYLRDAGVKPGMGLLDIYSAINAGGVGRYSASDANNGGAPGTVADKVQTQMAMHRKNAEKLMGRNSGLAAVEGARLARKGVDVDNLTGATRGALNDVMAAAPGLSVSSGYRSPSYNAKVGGAKGSRHMQGDAVDLVGVTPDNVGAVVTAAKQAGFTGFGYYNDGSLHMDMGEPRAWGPNKRASSRKDTPLAFQEAVAGGSSASELRGDAGADTIASANPIAPGGADVAKRDNSRLVEMLMSMGDGFSGGAVGTQISAPRPQVMALAEEAAMAPIVAEGGNVRNISFGGDAAPVTAEGIDRRRQLADALMSGGASSNNGTVAGGIGQVVSTLGGGIAGMVADRQEASKRQRLAQALMGTANGGEVSPALWQEDPSTAYQITSQRERLAREQQQAQIEYTREQQAAQIARQQALEDDERDQRQALELRQFDVNNREPTAPPAGVREYEFAVSQMPPDQRPSFTQWQRDNSAAGRSQTNIDMGQGEYKLVYERANQLQAAPNELASLAEARSLLDGGVISGAGADARLAAAKLGALVGITDPAIIENTEQFGSAMAARVLSSISVLGANPSNADREYLVKAAGGAIGLEAGSLRRIIDIGERTLRGNVDRFNSAFDTMAASDPKLARMAPMLRIGLPPAAEQQAAPRGTPAPAAAGVPSLEAQGAIRLPQGADDAPIAEDDQGRRMIFFNGQWQPL